MRTANIIIANNDPNESWYIFAVKGMGTSIAPTLSINDMSQSEGTSPMTFTVTLSSASASAVSVNYATSNGTAVAPGDYTSTSNTLTIPAGSTTGTISVPIINDTLDENDESFTVNLTSPVNATIAKSQGTGTIVDNDGAPTISINDMSQSEGTSPMNFTVTLSNASASAVSVSYSTSNGSAVAPGDYTSTSNILTIPAGSTTGTISVPIINDTLSESSETFTVNLTSPVNATIAKSQGTGTIVDNDNAPTLSINDMSQSEGISPMSFTVTLSNASASAVSVNFSTSNGSAVAPGDYTSTSNILTIPAGSTTGTISVPIINDTLDENDESFTVNLTSPVNATIADAQGIGTIIDNDGTPTISINDVSQSEGTSPMNFTVTLSNASASAVSVNYATNNGTAVAPGDYTSISGTLTIPPGNTTGTIPVTIINDALAESSESFTVNLTTPVNATIADSQGTGTILDNDGTPTLSINDMSQSEGTSPMTFTVTLSSASASAVSVNYATSNGTAVAPGDYTSTSNTLTIPAGSTTGTISVPIINDTLDENDESFTVNLTSPVNATIAKSQGTGTIVDNDGAPTISINDMSQSEGTSPMNFTVTLSNASASAVSVNFSTSNGSAVAPGDYTSTSNILTIPAGGTTGTISVSIINDTLSESSETFTVNLSSPINATIADAQGIGTIIDNDLPTVYLSSISYNVNENGGNAVVRIMLSQPANGTERVYFDQTPGTATSADYTPSFGYANFFTVGQTYIDAQIPIINDTLQEGNESFTVVLSNPIDCVLGTPQSAAVTIADNDVTTSPEIDLRFNDNGASIANGDTTPSTADGTDFGNADITTGSVTRWFRIWNTGTANLNLTGNPRVVISGANASDFTVNTQPGTSWIGSGGNSAQFEVIFNPSGVGVRTATISIANDDTSGNENPYNFTIQGTGTTTCPNNNDFNCASNINSLPYTNTQTDIGSATTASDDPVFTCRTGQRYNSVWYRVTPSVSGSIRVNTFGSNYDTVLAVWTGSRGALVSKGCNDDTTTTTQSEVKVDVVAGTTYYIEVAAYSQETNGSLTLNVIFGNVDVYIAGQLKGSYVIPVGGRVTPIYDGINNGPVQVVTTAIPIITSERAYRGPNLTDFNEMMGFPANQLTTEYWFPLYDTTSFMQTYLTIGNASTSQSANVDVYIAGQPKGSYVIPVGGRATPIYQWHQQWTGSGGQYERGADHHERAGLPRCQSDGFQ